MHLEKTIVFIDAGYFSVLSKHFGEGKRLKVDIIKFANYLANKQGLWCKHSYYYTAPPFQSDKPTAEEKRLKAGYDRFISNLKKREEITVREGRLQKIGNEFVQKGVDTLLTMDLAETPKQEGIKTIVLLACDTDFGPILERIRSRDQVKVILYYYTDRQRKSKFSMSNHILTACDNCCLLTEEHFKKNLME